MSWKNDRSFRLPRKWSNQVLGEIGPKFTGEIINVSGWRDQDKEGDRYKSYFPHATAYFISNYAGIRGVDDAKDVTDFEIDLEATLAEELAGRFDVVFNHTTLEHIFDIDTAFKNLCDMSRDVVIIVVPFAQQLHFTDSYGDYWRFTPMTLRRLFTKNGFSIIYEVANSHINSGIYLISIGSKNPELWENVFANHLDINHVGEWIGWNPVRKLYMGFKRLSRILRLGKA